MEQEHLIIVAILAVILYMLMKHSSNCNCSSCVNDKVVKGGYSSGMPAHIRMRDNGPPGPEVPYTARIRYSDKYIGAGQHIKQHLRHDSRQGMFSGMFSGSPQHIREGFDACDADPCAAGCPRAGTC